ncbi:MAG: CDP-diacylglycerol--serine O-phosphatidyltransferase [Chitinophagaceae bacterium]|nr:CDP-diacylglycerol--serine O-phosphatidyltransferase [Chitinophagaceae bacterium]
MLRFIKQQIPNIFTLCNLLSGCIGIIHIFHNQLEITFWCVVLSLVFDFLDGFLARVFGVSGAFGKELDSFSDMVSFGVLPSLFVYHRLDSFFSGSFIPYIGLLIAVFSAVRLAKFNIDTKQQYVFIGLPTPINALFFVSFFYADAWFFQAIPLISFTILFSWMLIAKMSLLAIKFQSFHWKNNEFRFIFLFLSGILLLLLGLKSIPFIVFNYIILSFFYYVILNKKENL